MNITKVVGATRSIAQLLAQVRHASTKTKTVAPQLPKDRPDHGHKIYIFNHIQTNQVVYSLTKVMKNNHAIGQLPYNGKKTVPRALRKDLWTPMATITFPPTESTSAQGLLAFRMLREYRRLHETQWDEELREKAKNKAEYGVPYSRDEIEQMNKQEKKAMMKRRKKALGRILSDQKANSVADMAAVLAKLDFNPPVEEVVVEDEVIPSVEGETETTDSIYQEEKVGNPEETVAKPEDPTEVKSEDAVADESTEEKPAVEEPIPEVPAELRVAADEAPIVVQWKDILDAEYAEKWPVGVVHDFLDARDAPPVVEQPIEEPPPPPPTEEKKGGKDEDSSTPIPIII